MFPTTSNPDAGKRLRADRERLRLSTRDVERLSQKIAEERNCPDYYLSHAWLIDIEAGNFKHNVCKLYSLSRIYRRGLDEILDSFGLGIRDFGKEHGTVVLPRTHLVPSVDDSGPTILAPIELRDRIRLEETNLVSRMFERWGQVPVGLLQQLDLRNSLYGYIGMEDYMLHPLIPPGSFVQIDPRQRKIRRGNWPSEYDRPIYFVELRDGYICCWCDFDGSQLLLVPTPQSREQTRHVRFPGDAEVVGRVTAVTMRIADMHPSGSR